MIKNSKRAIIDDGCNPELVAGAKFDGIFEIPLIERPDQIKIPSFIVPFTERNKLKSHKAAIGFHQMDMSFSDVLKSPEDYTEEFSKFEAIISPDVSLYRDAPLAVQIANTYRNRAIGHYYQKRGLYVIPQIRWGSEDTYTTKVLPEKIAFLGAEKHSILCIGTYGCIQHKNDKYHFKAGLESMLYTLEPEVVLVYGSMPNSIFGDYLHNTRFIQFEDWIKYVHGGKS